MNWADYGFPNIHLYPPYLPMKALQEALYERVAGTNDADLSFYRVGRLYPRKEGYDMGAFEAFENAFRSIVTKYANHTLYDGNYDGLDEIPMWTIESLCEYLNEDFIDDKLTPFLSVKWALQRMRMINMLRWAPLYNYRRTFSNNIPLFSFKDWYSSSTGTFSFAGESRISDGVYYNWNDAISAYNNNTASIFSRSFDNYYDYNLMHYAARKRPFFGGRIYDISTFFPIYKLNIPYGSSSIKVNFIPDTIDCYSIPIKRSDGNIFQEIGNATRQNKYNFMKTENIPFQQIGDYKEVNHEFTIYNQQSYSSLIEPPDTETICEHNFDVNITGSFITNFTYKSEKPIVVAKYDGENGFQFRGDDW